MTEHIIDISERAGRLSVRYDNLVLEDDEGTLLTMPLSEIAALVVSNQRVSYSHAVLAGIAGAGNVLVVCDDKHLPAAMLLPLNSHFTQAERFRLQADAPLPVKKRLWQQVVRAKLRAQGALLEELTGEDHGLPAMAKRVRSGDTGNLEGRAAQRYWPALFGPGFQRARAAEDINRHLNYGYAVLRALVARALCAAGLHPALGLHHHNRYNAFCLADDLMEPYRPLVDRAAAAWARENGPDAALDAGAKAALIGALTDRLCVEGEERTLFDVLGRCASSLVAVFEGRARGSCCRRHEGVARTSRHSGYRSMWVVAMFDVPVTTKKARRAYASSASNSCGRAS